MMCFRQLVIVLALLTAASWARAQDVRNVPDPDPMTELEQIEVAEGFEITLFAAEPMIAKPVRMAWDERGRLWVVGTTSYPQLEPGAAPGDRIVVLEDTDGDGRADSSTVFADGLRMPTGIAVGDGGAYVANSDELLHLRDTDGDGRADVRRVLLRGFGVDDTHHLINTFRWGPAGRLYFNQGLYTYSTVETPWGPRRLHGGGIWRLEPETRRLEVYTRGMWNPWGHEFDEWGQSFVTDGAYHDGIYYAFPGAHFVDAVGAERTIEGLDEGHPKYAGLEILSGRHLPDSLHGHLLTNDYRANRVVRFSVSGEGSGYRSDKGEAFVWTNHIAFRPVDVRMGPDGAIYLADWYNPIIQHGEIDFRDPRRDRRHGRIWRITAVDRPLVEPSDLAGATTAELLDALKQPEHWTRRQARRLLRERGGEQVRLAVATWIERLDADGEEYDRLLLEALWAAQAAGVVDEDLLLRVLRAKDPRARAAAVRALSDVHDRVSGAGELLAKAVRDAHPRVRLEAATALRQLRTAEAARTALEVLDAPMDRFLDFALWTTLRELEAAWLERVKASPNFLGGVRKTAYALKASRDPYAVARLTRMFDRGEVPAEYREDVLDVVARYGSPAELKILFERALASEEPPVDLLSALERAARRGGSGEARPGIDMDAGGRPGEGLGRIANLLAHSNDEVAALAARLIGLWGRADLRGLLVRTAESSETSAVLREASVTALAALNDRESRRALVDMTRSDRPLELRLLAAATLTDVDLALAAETAITVFGDMSYGADAVPVFRALLAREDGSGALVAAMEDGEMSVAAARAGLEVIRSKGWRWKSANVNATRLQAALEAIGGPLPPPRIPQNPSPQEIHRLELNARAQGDPARGELVYRRPELACQRCHSIGGVGGRAGPDLSSLGASAPMDYIIEAVLLPDEAVKDGYGMVNVTRDDGTVASGLLMRETDAEIVLRDASDREIVVPASRVRERAVVPGSLMPAGLTSRLEEGEFLDLVRFMTELGESDAFTPGSGWIRHWRAAAANEAAQRALAAADQDGAVGLSKGTAGADDDGRTQVAAGAATGLAWQPAYSMVSGELPLDDLPVIEGPAGLHASIVRFEVEVRRAGSVDLGLNGTEGLALWVDGESFAPLRDTVSIDLPEGTHRITAVLDRDTREAPLAVRVLESSTARVEPLLGR